MGYYGADEPRSRRADDGRHALIGTLTHRLLFTLLAPGSGPAERSALAFGVVLAGADQLLSATRTSPIERRALRQGVAGSTLAYLRMLLPPDSWRVLAVDVPVAGGRVDLVWHHGRDLLIDEVKTGPYGAGLKSSRVQVAGYLRAIDGSVSGAGSQFYPWPERARVVGARLLVTSRPEDSWFQPRTGRPVALTLSGLVRDRCPPSPDLVT